MDIYIYLLASIIFIASALSVLENPHHYNGKKWMSMATATVAIVLALSYIFSSETIEEMHDVSNYSGTTFAVPKTIVVETVSYPWWSINTPDTTWHVKDQK